MSNEINTGGADSLIAEVMQELGAEAYQIAKDCGLSEGDRLHIKDMALRLYRDGAANNEALDAAQAHAEAMSGIDRKAPEPMNSALAVAGLAAVSVMCMSVAGCLP